MLVPNILSDVPPYDYLYNQYQNNNSTFTILITILTPHNPCIIEGFCMFRCPTAPYSSDLERCRKTDAMLLGKYFHWNTDSIGNRVFQ